MLALETSDLAGSVALLDDDVVRAYSPLEPGQRSAQSLAPAIDQLLRDNNRQPSDIQLIAVTTGPGSFTGLRVGVTTAKTFGYAVGCPVVGVNTLEAIALRAQPVSGRVWAVIDAQRQQLFAACFESVPGGELNTAKPTQIISVGDFLAGLTPGDAVTGPGLAKFVDRIPAGVRVMAPELWPARAVEVGLLGLSAFRQGRRDDPFSLVPEYFRPTAAEEQWARKNAPPVA